MKSSKAPQRLVLAAIIFAVAVLFFPGKGLTATDVSGFLTADQTWTKSGSPYVVASTFRLNAGIHLTIEPGVIVKFRPGAELGPDLGFIYAIGTSTDPIIFTSYADDTVGGDANGDGNGSMPRRGDWLGIHVHNTASNIQFAEIRYGNACLIPDRLGQTAVQNNLVKNCAIGIDAGLLFGGVIKNNVLENNQYGIRAWFPDGIRIEGNSISKNSIYGIYFRDDAASAEVKQNNIFENGAGIFADHVTGLTVENNNIYDNGAGAENKAPVVFGIPQPEMDARNNWWGHASGPFHPDKNPIGSGNRISNGIIFVPWLSSRFDEPPPPPPSRNPVIIVPGILGTDLKKGEEILWANPKMANPFDSDSFMDPLAFSSDLIPVDANIVLGGVIRNKPFFDYSQGLLNELISQGYTENIDLFTFAYDWRYGFSGENNRGEAVNVKMLEEKINEVLNETHTDKVDVIAHSTGGLLLKKYVIDNPNSHHINKAIFVGVPNLGAPKAIKVLAQGDSFNMLGLNPEEIEKISKNLPVVYDLAPSQSYFDVRGSFYRTIDDRFLTKSNIITDLNFQETWGLLFGEHEANNTAFSRSRTLRSIDFENFDLRTKGIDTYNVVGCKSGTIGKVIERRTTDVNGNVHISFDAPLIITGDSTVPYESANSIAADDDKTFYFPRSDHAKMLSVDGIRQLLTNLLSDGNLDTKGKIITRSELLNNPSRCKLKGSEIKIYSPVDIEVIDQSGNRLGLTEDGSIENNIAGADITVFDDHKFLYLPEDEGDTYSIKLKGTGIGDFTMKISKINDDQITETELFLDIPVTNRLSGIIDSLNGQSSLSLDIDSDGVIDEIVEPTAILDKDKSQDMVSPITQVNILGDEGHANFYRSNMTMNLQAEDPIISGRENETSGLLKTIYSLDGGSYRNYQSSITIEKEGSHTLSYFSVDKAGNHEQTHDLSFIIDKTPPEIKMQFDPVRQDLIFFGTDNISSPENITILDNDDIITVMDEADNRMSIQFKEKNRKKRLVTEIKQLYYNDKKADTDKMVLKFRWERDKEGKLKKLEQSIKSKRDFYIEAIYKNNQTKIAGHDQDGKIKLEFPELMILLINTNKGDFEWAVY